MFEKTQKSIKKNLEFEESGERFSVEIQLENISPSTRKETVISFLNTLFERTIKEIKYL